MSFTLAYGNVAQQPPELTTFDVGRIVRVHSPRLVRGGFSFIF